MPLDSTKLTFNALDPGRLDILAVGTTVPDSLRDSLVWSITPIVGSTLVTKPVVPKGDSVWFRFAGLPDSNNQFGVKYLKASLVDYDVAESVMVKVFYPKDATNNPDTQHDWPNWYYYWKQTPAYVWGHQAFGGSDCSPHKSGYYTPGDTMFHVCDSAAAAGYSECDSTTWTGVDLFAATELHENTHLNDWWAFWPGGYVKLDAGVKWGNDSLTAHYVVADSVKVLGENPIEAMIRAYLRDGYTDHDKARQAEVIGQMESSYRQFRNTGAKRGFPLVSADNGVGIMQITPPPAVSRNRYWNWQTNVDGGKDILQDKWTFSNSWFDYWTGRGWPQPTSDNRLYDTYCRYNGGRYYSNDSLKTGEKFYARNLLWADSCGVCSVNNPQADRDTTGACVQSGCCYADDAMEIH
jgi:hypothetical protein